MFHFSTGHKMGAITLCSIVIIFYSVIFHNASGQSYVPQALKNKYSSLGSIKSSGSSHQTISKSSYSGGGGSSYGGNELETPDHTAAFPSYSGSSYGGYSSSNSMKTKTKSKSKQYNGGCTQMPPAPMNAGMRCSSHGGGCRADCIPEYQFPNGKTQIMILCVNGQWQVKEEPSWVNVPSCEPICLPECQNNGICFQPNQCQCPENFSGPQCQFENRPCLNFPPLPKNSRRSCRGKQCTVECLPGHKFPDGSGITNLLCNNGMWVPGKSQWVSVPDCQATCTPECINGGTCLSFNVCQCPQDFRGPQCQYSASVCSPKNMKFNGGYNCSGNMESLSCSIYCAEGIPFSFPPSPLYTCDYAAGVFTPTPQPECVFPPNYQIISHDTNSQHHFQNGEMYQTGSYQQTIDAGLVMRPEEYEIVQQEIYRKQHQMISEPVIFNEIASNLAAVTVGYGSQEHRIVNLVPKPGSCFSWGGTHYKTFDGKVFSFNSKCEYLLLKDSIDNTISISVLPSPGCFQNSKCYKIVKLYFRDRFYYLKHGENGFPVFASAKKAYPIPGQLPGVRFTALANYIMVSLDTLGLVLKWDGKQFLHIEASAGLWNRTEGLCGKLDGDDRNDLMTREGFSVQSITTLASSWKVDNIEDPCDDTPNDANTCGAELEIEAKIFCGKTLADSRFSACAKVVDITALMDSCKRDYCSCTESDRSTCVCVTLEVYVRECSHKGVKDIVKWRDDNICPLKCTNGKVYMTCTPKNGQAMCGAASLPASDGDDSCIEGCYCPEGTVLHESKCISKDQCPCKLRGKSFAPGASIPKECNTCTCTNGEWICTQVSCGARCGAIGDPHYVTFDGKTFDFMGQCSYYLVKTDNFSIEAENVACAGSISLAMNFPVSVSSGLPSCTKAVTIRYNGLIVKLKQNLEVVINGVDLIQIPYNNSGVYIRAASSIFLQVKLSNGIEIWWDGVTRVYIDAPPSFRDKFRGLCGTFNNNQKDDFLTPENDVEQSVIPFANKWKTAEKCNDVPDVVSTHPCDVNLQNKVPAEKYCSKIKSEVFEGCHWYVDPEQFYQNCLYDMCACEYQISRCLCPTVAAYATECSRKGLSIEWRNKVRECGIHCSGGQKYQVCANSCTRTCSDLINDDCKPQCVEGCNCPDGEALDDNGECIPIGQCKCQQDGLDFQAGYKEIRPGTHGLELCTCLNGLWQCRLAHQTDIQLFPKANDLKAKCDSSRNFEFTTCENVEPRTCKNMHNYEEFSAAICHAGCQCKKGHVLDSKNKKCVQPNECPCHHGGRSYKEKSIVQSDCNTCTCNDGKWGCTDRQCTAECFAWGDSHYKTFDGKYYDYQGQCDFVMAKGSLELTSFDVTLQNIPCGSLGTSCSKSVTIRVVSNDDVETVTLTREDKSLPKFLTKKHFTLREKGLFVIVEASELGLIVQWDKGTRVYVKLIPKWKSKIKGLCGNYNDNEEDDFQTPSGGLVEASAKIFGDSWRLQDYCPEALELSDTCLDKPERRSWAIKKCGLLKSPLFAPCHSQVPLDAFYERCVFDACACDQGGDCQCLCTALAAYAQQCNSKGAPVKWRSQQLCPLQCDLRCSVYSPCISTCPFETCDNLLINGKLSKSCNEDVCIEGCNPKPCPPGHVYWNESYIDCVPRNICKPVCMELDGLTIFEGDLMEEDPCHSCYCSRGEMICKGQPCTTIAPPSESTTVQHEQKVQCVSGWTPWINHDKLRKNKHKLSDFEPLPTEIILNNLQNSSKCGIDQMVSIECLTVDGRHPKELGLDVECSLERGLICKSTKECPDFKIKVLCKCEEEICDVSKPTQEHPDDCHKFLECSSKEHGNTIEKTCGNSMMYNPETMVCDWPENVYKLKPICNKSKCPIGMVENDCAIECDNLCAFYLYTIKEKGLCSEGTVCELGCVKKDRVCPKFHLWLNENTCVSKHDCLCVSEDNKPVKPGQVIKLDGCKECQCLDNHISCSSEECKADFNVPPIVELVTETISTTTVEYLVPSVTPPPECSKDQFIDLVQGDQPLSDSAFSASSSLSSSYSPSKARMNSEVSSNSGGNWSPQNTNPDQYLDIDLGRQEPIYGIIIKGSPVYEEFVTSFMVMYSPDESSNFYYVLNKEIPPRPQIFRGSLDGNTAVEQIFSTPFEATKVRIKPQTWNNVISLRVELLGCSEQTTTVSYVTSELPKSLCDDEMGLSNHALMDRQIRVSSELSGKVGKKHIRLNSDSYWQPLTNSPTEFAEFDFLEARDITGIVTKGGKKGWVTAFTVKYSQDAKDWNPILDDFTHTDKTFLGNFDGVSPQVNNFILPIHARYLKIIPKKWQTTIQLRVEIHGCFKPYLELEPLATTTEVSYPCNNCPGIDVPQSEFDVCRCVIDQWFDGINCVNRTQCPCMVGHITYEVGSVFEKEDCSDCICKLGGVAHCTQKVCGNCKEGLKSIVTSTCKCSCQPCPNGTRLCPRSNICINSTLWCNGVRDCPDDEIDCSTTVLPVPTTKPPKTCPIVDCQAGFKREINEKVTKNQFLSPLLNAVGVKTKSATVAATKHKSKKPSSIPKSRLVEEELICPEVRCVIDKPNQQFGYQESECPKSYCQPNYIAIIDKNTENKHGKLCPKYSCYPPPLPDAFCNITGRTFNTFDGTEFKYDICNHVVARDIKTDDWEVVIKKNCTTKDCTRYLIIYHDGDEITLRSDLSINYNNYEYNVEQIKTIGNKNKGFSILDLGHTVLFISNKFGFYIFWNKLTNIKLGVAQQLMYKIDGLCGYFNDEPKDDKRKPDGKVAKTTAEFGDSWAIDLTTCEIKTCPMHIQNKAWEICNKVKETPLNLCAKVLDIEAFVSRCLDTACSCLENADSNFTATEECRCSAMQTFVVDCLSADETVDLSDWRMQQDCPATCEAPLVYHDCYNRKCEPTCEAIGDPYICPKISNICFPGCYCPAGYVKKGKTCIKPSSCRDCECNVLPHLQYVTYDDNNFTINGNCVYVMSRDGLEDLESTHKWQILITNHPCKGQQKKMCVGKVTILYQGKKIHILVDSYRNKLKLIVDNERISDFEEIEDFAKIWETSTKHLKILLTDVQVEVSVYYPSLGVSVKASSHKYGGKLEGLCGDCNKNRDDDIKYGKFGQHRTGTPKDINDFALSWLYESLPGGQTREQCENQPEENCVEIPPKDDACLQLVNEKKFGQCLNVLDPSLFLDWCKKDTCGNKMELSCASMEAFAKDCAAKGFCINWRNEHCPAPNCGPGQFYQPCATTQQNTCADVEKKKPLIVANSLSMLDGCYCPEGKVLLNDTCVLPKECQVCDEDGHHDGDVWKRDKCTTCRCEGTSLKCDTQQCAGAEKVCEKGFNAVKIPIAEDTCCEKYACVPEPTSGPTCEPPQKLVCAPDQVLKLDTRPNGCQIFICECKLRIECDPIHNDESEILEPGFVREVDDNGCCPMSKLVCKKDQCPPSKECPQYFILKKDELPGGCCPIYSCEAPKDKCIFETGYVADEAGGERAVTTYEKQKLLKSVNDTWLDGPCRECQCVTTSSASYQPICSKTDCLTIDAHEDFKKYDLKLIAQPGDCCAKIKRSACKFANKVYKVGEEWQHDGDYCKSYKCVETDRITMETSIENCGSNDCKLGFKYEPASAESKECCGKCVQVACVAGDIVRKLGEKWMSDDSCTKYECTNDLQVKSEKINCPKITEDDFVNFKYESYEVEGECCKVYRAVACKVDDKIYKIGESWPSPDGDKCKTITCVEKSGKTEELSKQESIETCKKDCANGWKYKVSETNCCGECIQTACVVDGVLKQPDEEWKSKDGCATFSCDKIGDQLSVSSSYASCPSIDDCPKENVYTQGCCQYCNVTVKKMSLCSPQAIPLKKTIEMIQVERKSNGKCVNKEPIRHFTECIGTCHSSTSFNLKTGLHESVCSCCQATSYQSLDIKLECKDGYKWTKKVAVPLKCSCAACGTGEHNTGVTSS